jgi:hypothetical protein
MVDLAGVGFMRPSSDAVQAEDWLLNRGGAPERLPPIISDWDYNLDLGLSRTVVVDMARVRRECRLPEDSAISLAAVWQASGTALRGVVGMVSLETDMGRQRVVVRGIAPGREAAGVLTLQTQLLLSKPPATPALLVPSLAGSILWQDAAKLTLEGGASRFPIEVVDFSKLLWAPAGAGWHLAWNSHDLYLPLSASLTLYINADHPPVLAAVKGTRREPHSDAIRSAIYYDVGRALVRGALNSDEFMEDPDGFPEASLGNAVRNLLHLLFPGDRPEALRSTMRERSEFFDSSLQESMRLFSSTP